MLVLAGDRVLIGGTKIGNLRYLGTTDFAKGEWAGVELDDPIGKNDGAVAGKRYFRRNGMTGLKPVSQQICVLCGNFCQSWTCHS